MGTAGITRVLEQHTLVDTQSPDEARQEIGRIFCPHFLAPGPEGQFHAIHRSFRHKGISLNFVTYGSSVEIDPGRLTDFFLLQVPISGTGRVTCGPETVHVAAGKVASILSPNLPTHMYWDAGCEKIIVRIDKNVMLQRVEALAGRKVDAIEFATAVDIGRGAGRLLMDHLRLMIEAVEAGGPALGNYLTRLAEGMADLLLTAFDHSARNIVDHPVQSETINVVSRAEDWVQANIDISFTAPEVAKGAGTSLRSLQEGIRRQKGTTLTELVETIRLEHFRSRLVKPSETTSVTDAAMSSGLGHLGRAAMAYRRRYGETPHETLRKSR